jgi:hypothetical protein
MPGWLIASVIVICLAIWLTSWTLAHLPWIALGAVLGWFIREGYDWVSARVT